MQGLNVVIGLGKTGLSCLRFGLQKGWRMAVMDSREHPPEEAAAKAWNVPMVLGGFSSELMKKAERLIISPGVSLQEELIQEAMQRGIPCVGDIELFAQEVKAPVVAITGSNAKSTVVTLVYEMAKASGLRVVLAGNIGTPVLDSLSSDPVDLYVLELSSFQLETTYSLCPKVATILNITEDHMDRYDSLEAYRAAKMRIYQHAQSIVINRKDPLLCPALFVPIINFGLDAPKKGEYGVLENNLAYGQEKLLPMDQLRCAGLHYVENTLAALAIGEMLNLSRKGMISVLKNFSGLPH
jgi:UDP-N-acetylmuramoylalanine--D-glutamate ligase